VSSGHLEYMKRGNKRFIKIGAQVVDPWSWTKKEVEPCPVN
jgi:hypothetical protein